MATKKNTGVEVLQQRINESKNNAPEPSMDGTSATGENSLSQTTEQETQKNSVKVKKKQKYLRLDITDYQDYISLMAAHEKAASGKYVSMTQYILRLIEADKQQNIELYEKLEQIEKMKQELI